jgi:thiaminase
MRFTEALREENAEQWERVTKHKFTKELASGKIDREGKHSYSCYENSELVV